MARAGIIFLLLLLVDHPQFPFQVMQSPRIGHDNRRHQAEQDRDRLGRLPHRRIRWTRARVDHLAGGVDQLHRLGDSHVEAIALDRLRCGADLHACAQCTYFDTSARWECTQKILARIADKKRRNECTFFKAKESFDLTGARGGTATPDDARAAFERLFKK